MEPLSNDRLEEVLATLGAVLAERGAGHELAVIGGSGLLLLGTTRRATRDVDVVALVRGGELVRAQPLPPDLEAAAEDVALALGLDPGWLNAGPSALLDFGLPEGFLARCSTRRFEGLVVHVASRLDQIHFKLYAAADHGPASKHVSDLRALAPTTAELMQAARWCRTQDPSDGFLASLAKALAFFGVEVSDGDL